MPTACCYLQNKSDPEKKIILPDKVEVKVGRNPESEIEDPRVSRVQLVCTANYSDKTVAIKPIGTNFSTCNGYALEKEKKYNMKHHDQIELIVGSYPFEIVFEEEKEDSPCQPSKKLKMSINSNESKNTEGSWEHIDGNDLLIYTSNNCEPRPLIASFDIDGTIIQTKSGAKFPKDFDDWMFKFPCVPKKLKELDENGYKIVFFTNQSSLSRDATKIKPFKSKVEHIVTKLAVPVQVYVATGKTMYRKPMVGMWNTLYDIKNDNVKIDIDKSFYVGDAAGREKNWAPKKPKDHSNCDRLFGLNVGIKFYTPEEYFLKASPVKYIMPQFDPRKAVTENYPDFESEEQEVILMVGVQGSGKSHFCRSKLVPKGYVYINRDSLGTWQKCVKMLEECLKGKKSAVVDNTNGDKNTRSKYIEVAKKFKVKCRCFLMTTSHNQSKHNNKFREYTDKSHMVVSDIILNSYRKNFQPPDLSEGFDEIVKIPCIPVFDDPEKERLYKMFLLES